MKKLLLIGSLALGMSVGASAQKFESQVIAKSHENVMTTAITSMSNVAAKQFAPTYIKGNIDPRSGKTIVDLGTDASGYYAKSRFPVMFSEHKSGTTIFVHTGDNDEFVWGNTFYDYTQNGTDWVANNPLYVTDDTQFGFAYFPQVGIYNPNNSTNIEDTYLGFIASQNSNENGLWGSYAIGGSKFGVPVEAPDNQEIIFNADDEYYSDLMPHSCTVGNNIFLVSENTDNNGGGFKNNFIFVKGTFDPETETVTYERNLIDIPSGLFSEEGGPFQLNVKFANDGQTGYIFTTGNANPNLFDLTWWPSFYMKTTDGGQTWSDMVPFEYGGENMLDALKGLVDETMWDEVMELTQGTDPYPGEENLAWDCPWQYDGVVDANGDLHMAIALNLFNETPTGRSYLFSQTTNVLLHVYTKGDDTKLHSDLVTVFDTFRKLYTGEEGPFESVTHNHRPRVIANEAQDLLLFTWSDSEFDLTPDEEVVVNKKPSVFGRGYQVGKDGADGHFIGDSEDQDDKKVNFTFATLADEVAHFYHTTESLITSKDANGNTIAQVPVLYTAFTNETDPKLSEPMHYKYLAGCTFNFKDGTVGLDEVAAGAQNVMEVSQNVPNPFNGTTKVTVNLANASDLSVEVVDMAGQKVMNIEKGFMQAGSNEIEINASQLQAGIYFYTVSAGAERVTKKMIVK